LTTNEQEEKKTPRITELVAIVSVMVTILIAGTSLLSNSANVPWWWFHFSFIILIALTFFIPSVIFFKPISKRFKKRKLERKQNAVARKYFPEFRNLVDTSKRFNSNIRDIFSNLKSSHDSLESSLVTYILQSYQSNEIDSMFYFIDKEINASDKTFRELCLIMKHLESVLEIYKKNLRIIEEFVHEIRDFKGKKIAKGIEAKFESFREKYNYFVKDFKKYCQKVNQELGEREFPEWAIDYVKKW